MQKGPGTGQQKNITEMLCKLVKEQAPKQVDSEIFDGNHLECTYFMSMFRESAEKKIEDSIGRLTRLIQYTRGEIKDLIKNFINDTPEYGHNNAMAVIHRQYRNPHTLLSSYRREVRQIVPLKAGNATAFRKLFNFLIKCQTTEVDGHYNPFLDTPKIICTVLSKLPLHLQDRWNRNPLQLRRQCSKGPQLIDLTNCVEDEITLANDPLYSRNAVNQYVNRAPRYSEEEVQCNGNSG